MGRSHSEVTVILYGQFEQTQKPLIGQRLWEASQRSLTGVPGVGSLQQQTGERQTKVQRWTGEKRARRGVGVGEVGGGGGRDLGETEKRNQSLMGTPG